MQDACHMHWSLKKSFIQIHTNPKRTDKKELRFKMIKKILLRLGNHRENEPGWYYTEIITL